MKAHFAQMVPLARLGRAEEMAKAILFLASDDSSCSTGITWLPMEVLPNSEQKGVGA